jgi:alpha-beta hydrolase superfamily lysophospholipase
MHALITSDGLTLHQQAWLPDTPSARGTVLIVHGLGEHIGRYAHVAQAMQLQGWCVRGYDQRGHGQSQGDRGCIAAPDSLLADLGQFISQARKATPAGPLVLLGHSMGGAVVGRYVAEGLAATPAPWWQPVDGLVMSSPALDLGMSAAQKLLLAGLGPVAPNLAVGNGLKPDWISRDAAVVQAYVADPLVHDRVAPRLVRFLLEAGELVRQRAAQWALPTLLLYAGADRCVAPRGSDAFAAQAPAAVASCHRYDGLAHEIFNEPEQAQVLADLLAWLNQRF